MDIDELKSWIENNCFIIKKSGKCLNNWASKPIWWNNRNPGALELLNSLFSDIPTIEEKIYLLFNNRTYCAVCNSKTTFHNYKRGYLRTCSLECSCKDEERSKKLSKAFKGIKRPNSPFKRPEVREKARKNLNEKIEKVGVDVALNFEKKKQTTLERYGHEEYRKSEVWNKRRAELLKEAGGCLKLSKEVNEKINNIEYLIELNKNLNADQMADLIGVTPATIYNKMGDLYEPKSVLLCKIQNNIKEYIENLGFNVIFNTRKIIKPLELDLYIPDKNIAIELNGVYYHSSIDNSKRYKHFNKFKLCNELGIRLIQITDLEWFKQNDICKSIINSALGIYNEVYRASKLNVKDVPSKDVCNFYDENHIQGYGHRCKVNKGLYYNNELVACISIQKGELVRYCQKQNIKLHGGFAKLFNEVKDQVNFTYSHNDYFNGNVYRNNGFTFEGYTTPGYFYVKGFKKLTRYKCQKKKLEKMEGFEYNNNLTELENMINNGWRIYYNAGNSKWRFN